MAVEIREYCNADQTALVACMKELQAYIASLDDLKRTRIPTDFDEERYVQKLLKKMSERNGMIYLADNGGKIAGCIAGIIPKDTEDNDLEGYPSKDGKILELYVHPGHRGQKIGLRLMQTMEQYFKTAGCIGCHVDCFAPNVDAHKFYLKVGYVDRLTTLLKIL